MIALHSPANNRFVTMDKNGHVRASWVPFSSLGTQKENKHKHFIGISLPYWASLLRGFIWDIPILMFAYLFFESLFKLL